MQHGTETEITTGKPVQRQNLNAILETEAYKTVGMINATEMQRKPFWYPNASI